MAWQFSVPAANPTLWPSFEGRASVFDPTLTHFAVQTMKQISRPQPPLLDSLLLEAGVSLQEGSETRDGPAVSEARN